MTDYGRPLRFGVFVTPDVGLLENSLELARIADKHLDYLAVQDYPYQRRFLDAWAFMSHMLLVTERVRVLPDVANVALRNPAVLAKTAASLNVLSGGRVELALGAGAFRDPIVAMGGPRRTPKQAAAALREAVEISRLMWSGQRAVWFDGEFSSLKGLHPGPRPAHPMQIWLGVGGSPLLRYVGSHADGWLPSNTYFEPDKLPGMQAKIDAGAVAAGREPGDIVRAYNVFGEIDDTESDREFHGTVAQWVDTLTDLAIEVGIDTFIFAAPDDDAGQVRRFATEVAPTVRDAVTRRRG